jgi:hypothetical protein
MKKRTLTALYNERSAWLDNLHRALDCAVAAAYGWPEDITADDALARLLALNHKRAGQSGSIHTERLAGTALTTSTTAVPA